MYQHPRTLTKSGEKHILENRVQFIKAFFELEKQKMLFHFFCPKVSLRQRVSEKNVYSHT